VLAAVKVITRQHQKDKRVIPLVPDYEGGPVSLQVVRVVLSYTDYVNRTVWRKD
jgi:UDP-N-acetylglucosamine 2-epimerase (non-hydrolysing)